jgi:hypothetical protein
MKLTVLSLMLAAGLVAGSAQAASLIDPQTYSMQDGPINGYGYNDQSYTGSRDPYGWLSGGEGDLTNAAKGMQVGGGYDAWAPYVLWDGFSPVITFDLGANYAVSEIQAYFLYYPNAAVYIPPSANIRFSADGVNFGTSLLRTFSTAERTPGGNDTPVSYNLLASAGSGRYVEVTLTTPDRWIALSEVEFYGTATPVPEPETYALMLAGLGLVGFAARRRT